MTKGLEAILAETVKDVTNFRQEYYSDKKEFHKKLNGNLERLWEAIKDMGKDIDKLKDRPPVWATVVIAILSSAVTGLLVSQVR